MLDSNFSYILINSNAIIDFDKAIIRYMIKHYIKSPYIKDEARDYTKYYLEILLMGRTIKNPLSCIFKNEYLDQIDNLYDEILDRYKKELMTESMCTSLVPFLRMIEESNYGYTFTINCKDELEVEFLKGIFKEKKYEYVINQKSVEKYFTLFVKDISDALEMFDENTVRGKAIYMWDYRLNYDEDGQVNPIGQLLSLSNQIKIITPYANLKYPEKPKEEDKSGGTPNGKTSKQSRIRKTTKSRTIKSIKTLR